MEFRYAIVNGGVVRNIVMATVAFAAARGWIFAPAGVSRGWLYDAQTQEFSAPPPYNNVNQARRARSAEVDDLRDQHIALGCEADVNGDESLMIPLDMRNATDLTNIHGFATNALAAARANVTDPVLKFRGANNVTHSLTPNQAITLGEIAARYYANCYERAWALKDEIASAGTVAAVMAIDITTGWPNQ